MHDRDSSRQYAYGKSICTSCMVVALILKNLGLLSSLGFNVASSRLLKRGRFLLNRNEA